MEKGCSPMHLVSEELDATRNVSYENEILEGDGCVDVDIRVYEGHSQQVLVVLKLPHEYLQAGRQHYYEAYSKTLATDVLSNIIHEGCFVAKSTQDIHVCKTLSQRSPYIQLTLCPMQAKMSPSTDSRAEIVPFCS